MAFDLFIKLHSSTAGHLVPEAAVREELTELEAGRVVEATAMLLPLE